MDNDAPKHAGRPLKFATVQMLQQKVDEYFGDCDPHIAKQQMPVKKADGTQYWAEVEVMTDQKPYTVTGLALALETSRKTLIDYESGKYDDPDLDEEVTKQFSNTITRAKLKCHGFAEQHLYTGKTPAGAMFSLKNNFGWVDESKVANTLEFVESDLDALEEADDARVEASDEAKKELDQIQNEGNQDEQPRPEAQEQVVEAETPLQDQG